MSTVLILRGAIFHNFLRLRPAVTALAAAAVVCLALYGMVISASDWFSPHWRDQQCALPPYELSDSENREMPGRPASELVITRPVTAATVGTLGCPGPNYSVR